MRSLLPFLSLFCLVSGSRRTKYGPLNVPPAVIGTNYYGPIQDNSFNPYLFRDGGGGGYINGYHFIGFSDTLTTTGAPNGPITSFVHNTIAYFGEPGYEPPYLQNIGGQGYTGAMTYSDAVFNAVTPSEIAMGSSFAIWPNANFVPIGGNKAAAIFNCVQIASNSTSTTLYNTLVNLEIDAPSEMAQPQIKSSRPVPVLFGPSEPMYGTFGLWRGHKHTYMFAINSGDGIKVARADNANLGDKSLYRYWNGSDWSATMPSLDDPSSNIISYTESGYGPDSGDVFWSPHFNTFVTVFHIKQSGHLVIAYALEKRIAGKWSAPQVLYHMQIDPNCPPGSIGVIYDTHSYPSYDPTGKTLLLSWSSCSYFVSMGQVSFA